MARRDDFVVGLDIGTRQVRAVVAESDEKGIHITGIGAAESHGLRGGMVVNIESTSRAIRKAIDDAGRMAGCEIGRVYVAVGGHHLEGTNSEGVVAVKDGQVRGDDQDRVLDAARAIKVSSDREFLQMLPQKFRVDDTDGIRSPIGITGVRLEARVHVITAAKAALQNLRRCVAHADLEIEGLAANPLVASQATLFDDEKELGVVLVDIGAGTTDVSIWHDNAIVHSAVLPFGGTHITSDVAFGLRTPRGEAEIIKCKHGCATVHLVDEDDIIEVASVGGRPAKEQSRQFLAEIIEPRVAEILEHVRDEVRKSGYNELLASGAVITGGSANLEGLTFMAEEIFDMPVRVGHPTQVSGLKDMVTDPSYAVAVGLVKHGYNSTELIPLDAYRRGRGRGGVFNWFNGAMRRLGSIFF